MLKIYDIRAEAEAEAELNTTTTTNYKKKQGKVSAYDSTTRGWSEYMSVCMYA